MNAAVVDPMEIHSEATLARTCLTGVNDDLLRELLPTINVALQEVWEAAGARRARKQLAAAGHLGTAATDDGNAQGAKKLCRSLVGALQPQQLALPPPDAAMLLVEPECSAPYAHPLPLSG